jgi:hypothetical protein
VLVSTSPPRSFKVLRMTGSAVNPNGRVRPPPNAVVYTVQVTTPSIGLQLAEGRRGFVVRGFAPSMSRYCRGRVVVTLWLLAFLPTVVAVVDMSSCGLIGWLCCVAAFDRVRLQMIKEGDMLDAVNDVILAGKDMARVMKAR